MGLKCYSIFVALLAIAGYFTYQGMFAPLSPPKLDTAKYWGPSWGPLANARANAKSEVKPFKIDYSADVITKLRKRLSEPLNLVEPLENVGFRYGFNKYKLEELIKYWRDDYLPRWNERQKFLNQFPQFTTTLHGFVFIILGFHSLHFTLSINKTIIFSHCSLNIHFIHTKDTTAKAKNVIPLLLLHGWPGSVREFYGIIPKLMQAKDDTAYVVVAPSLVGYGFSEAAAKPGMNPTEMAIVFRNLMISLGYDKFLVQGGDWGALIGSNLATLFPENVIGLHSNMCGAMSAAAMAKGFIASFYPTLFVAPEHVDFFYPASEKFSFMIEESGYFHLQATKPDTIGKYNWHSIDFYSHFTRKLNGFTLSMRARVCTCFRCCFGTQSRWAGRIHSGKVFHMDQ